MPNIRIHLIGLALIIGVAFAATVVNSFLNEEVFSFYSFIYQGLIPRNELPVLYWFSTGLNFALSIFCFWLIRKVPSKEKFQNYKQQMIDKGPREPKPLFKPRDKNK